MYYFFFFFNDTAPTEIYTSVHTLSLHDALPISSARSRAFTNSHPTVPSWKSKAASRRRSAEHTSELQSRTLISYAVLCLKNKTSHRERLQASRRPKVRGPPNAAGRG